MTKINSIWKSFLHFSASAPDSTRTASTKHNNAGKQVNPATTSTVLSKSARMAWANKSKMERLRTFLRIEKNNRSTRKKGLHADLVGPNANIFETSIMTSIQIDESDNKSWSARTKDMSKALTKLKRMSSDQVNHLSADQINHLSADEKSALRKTFLNISMNVQEQLSRIEEIIREKKANSSGSNTGFKELKDAKKVLDAVGKQVEEMFLEMFPIADFLRDLADRMRELDAKHEEIATSIETLTLNIPQKQEQIDRLPKKIDSLQKKIDSLQKKIDSLQEPIDSLHSLDLNSERQIDSSDENKVVKQLTEEKERMQEEIGTMQEEIDRMDDDLFALSSSNTFQKGRLTELKREQQDLRTKVADHIVYFFSKAAKADIDLSNDLSHDEIIYLTRATGSSKKFNPFYSLTGEQQSVVREDKKEKFEELVKKNPEILKLIDPSIDNQKKLAEQNADFLYGRHLQRLLDRLIGMEKKLNESIDDLKSLQPNSAAMVRERTEEISRALRNFDKSEVSRLCNRSGAKGEKAKSDIAHQFGLVKAKAEDLHNAIIIKTGHWSQTSGFNDEDIRQLKRATKLLRGDIRLTVLLDEPAGGSKAGSAMKTLEDLLLADPFAKKEEIHVDTRPNVSSEDDLSATSKQESIELFYDSEGELRVLESVPKKEKIPVDTRPNVSSEDNLNATSKQESIELFFDSDGELRVLERGANSESAHGGNSARPKWETDVLEALEEFTPATDKWLQDNNYAVVTNHGKGMNCLLISLLQHASGRYDDEYEHEHERLAQQIRAKLEENHGDIEPDGMLSVFPGNDSIFQAAVAMINDVMKTNLDPILVFPTEDGHPNKGRDDDKIEIGSQKNLIVYGRKGDLHFEALRRNASTIQNRNDGRETNTLAMPVVDSAANKKALEQKSLLARARVMAHIKGKSEDPSIRNMDRPLKGDNLERFKERMDECVASVRTAQSWQEKAASVKDIQQHLQGAEKKLAELNRGEAQELAKVLGKLLQNIEGQQKIQSRLSAEEESRTLREQTVSTLGAVAYQLKGAITRVEPLKFLEFSETQIREKISIAAPGKSWKVKHQDILALQRALNGLGPEIDRLQIAPTSRETSLANTARKLEVASLLDSLQMQIHEEQEQMQRPKSKNSTEAQVKTLQAEVAKQLEQYIRKCYPLELFRERVGAPDGELDFVPALESFEDIVRECLHPTDDGPGDDPKRIRHLNYLQSKLAEVDNVNLWDLISKEVEVLAERIDWLREDVAEKCEEIENRLALQNSEDTQAVDDMEEELEALGGVADELDRLLGLCRSSSTAEPVATQSEASSESEDDYGTADVSPLDQRLTRSV